MSRLSRLLLLGGLAAGAAYARRNQQQVKGLVDTVTPSPSAPSAPPAAPAPADAPIGTAAAEPGPSPAPPVANADVAGPPQNTATHVPAPEPLVHEPEGGIDEAAEEAAAAAEAANIGGTPEVYPDLDDPSLVADEAARPLEEAGEGYNEGQELAETDLIENAEPAAGDPLEGGRQIDDVIEAQDDPFSGESDEVLEHAAPPTGEPVADVPPPPTESSPSEKGSAVWRLEEQPTVEAESVPVDDPDRPSTQDGA